MPGARFGAEGIIYSNVVITGLEAQVYDLPLIHSRTDLTPVRRPFGQVVCLYSSYAHAGREPPLFVLPRQRQTLG
jgi:hypothetical protein